MKITFYRQGHANNSSSSHSLIFMSTPPITTETQEFGWNHFVAADQESRKNYILLCLKYSFEGHLGLSVNYKAIDYEEIESFKSDLFKRFIRLEFSEFNFDTSVLDGGYVDHQSVFTFPIHRITEKLHVEFARDLIKFFLNNNFVVLGGNDNGDEGHPLRNADESQFDDFKTFWTACKEMDPQSLLCLKDDSTGEYVISNKHDGNLLKVKF